jgi:hypothetical protein
MGNLIEPMPEYSAISGGWTVGQGQVSDQRITRVALIEAALMGGRGGCRSTAPSSRFPALGRADIGEAQRMRRRSRSDTAKAAAAAA